MRQVRLFIDQPLKGGAPVTLDERGSHYLRQVLRMRVRDPVTVFNGQGGCFSAEITAADKRATTILPLEFIPEETESALRITLVQGLARGQKMDYVIQKAVELGVERIVPVVTERSQIRLSTGRADKRLSHWQGVVISACEQSGRNRLPPIEPPMPLADWLAADDNPARLALVPEAAAGLDHIRPEDHRLTLLVGPEGGLGPQDREALRQVGYQEIRLGPRILRTETAAVAALAACQARWGDLH